VLARARRCQNGLTASPRVRFYCEMDAGFTPGSPPSDVVMIVCILAALVATAASVVAAVLSRRAWPIELQKVLKAQQERVLAAEAIAEGLQAKWSTKAAEFTAFLEEIEGVLDAVERKRRRVAASEQPRGEHAQGLPTDPGARRAAIAQLARDKGFRV